MTFNDEQLAAVEAMLAFLAGPDRFFLLSGAAGTGKTFCIKHLVESTSKKIVFTAPTNKATKVLRSTLTTEDYFPECRTTYSLLGLKLEADGAVKKLRVPDKTVDLSQFRIVVVDEASMINQALWGEIARAAEEQGLKFIFMGDRNQLPPVGEPHSEIWGKIENKAELLKVMRFDNQILVLAEKLKAEVDKLCPNIKLADDNDEVEGVWLKDTTSFNQMLLVAAVNGDFTRAERPVKAIAWRNSIVAMMNKWIREQIFDNANENTWLVGDRVILTSPANNPTDNRPIGCTDDEGSVERIEIREHPTQPGYQCYNLSVLTDENKRISLWVLHERSKLVYERELKSLADRAKLNGRVWKDFWAFCESFHQVQYGYAITAHRAQGSTYDTAYVAWNDILLNRNRNEGFRCLYVAATRPKRKLILGSV